MKKVNRLGLVYNNNNKIMDAGFTMQSDFILPVLSRMVDEGLLNYAGQSIVQTILSYKHTSDNPFPSRDELALRLGKSVSYVRKALSSINDTGIILIEKVGRKNTYNLKPLFSLVSRFISEFKDNKNHSVKITELLDTDKKAILVEEDFKEDSTITVEEDAPEEVVAFEENVSNVNTIALPNNILTLLTANNICSKGIEAVSNKYTSYSNTLDDAVFMQKIVVSSKKKNFIAFFNTCIDNAFINNEKPSESPTNRSNRSSGHTEVTPEWWEATKAEEDRKKIEALKSEEDNKINVQEQSTISEKPMNTIFTKEQAKERRRLLKESLLDMNNNLQNKNTMPIKVGGDL